MAFLLHWADYVIFALFFGISLAIGVYHACSGDRQRSVEEFLVANRQLSVFPTVMSLVMTYLSALTIQGGVAEMYTHGVSFFCWYFVGLWLAIICTERAIVPWLFPLKLTSVNEYYEKRFNSKAVQIFGSLVGICNQVLYIGVVMYAPSIAMEAVTGLSVNISIPAIAIVGSLYTALGGMKAVIWTDVFQGIVVIVGLVSVVIRANVLTGGIQRVMEICEKAGRLQPASRSFDPTTENTVWSLSIGFFFGWLYFMGISQAAVQRYTATDSLRRSRSIILWGLPTQTFVTCLALLAGLSIYAFFDEVIRCDPLENDDIRSLNQLFPYFVRVGFESFYGFQGLILAALYSGSLSSVSSSLSGCCANVWEDIIKQRHFMRNTSEKVATVINKVLVMVIGVLGMGFAFLCVTLPGSLFQIALRFSGACKGPLLGTFLLGGMTRTNWIGALTAGITSFALNIWLLVGGLAVKVPVAILPPAPMDGCYGNNTLYSNYTVADYVDRPGSTLTGLDRFYSLFYLWYSPLGVAVCFIVGPFISLITKHFSPENCDNEIDEDYLIPWRAIFSFNTIPGREHLLQQAHDKDTDHLNDNKSSSSPHEFDNPVDIATKM